MVYRLWAIHRCGEHAEFMSDKFHPYQGGGKGTLDAETLTLEFLDREEFRDMPYASSLDFQKAFDTTELHVALRALEWWGVPRLILQLVADQWKRQQRFLSFGGAVASKASDDFFGMPQGDPFPPGR